jgi:hypothetical protein
VTSSRWLLIFVTACFVQPYPGQPVGYQQDPSQQQAARANALGRQLARADRLAGAGDDARAVRDYRAVVIGADRLLAESPRPEIADPVGRMRERAARGVDASRQRDVRVHRAPSPELSETEQPPPPDEPDPPAPSSSSSSSSSSSPAPAKKSKLAYYAAATFASGSCSFGDCLKDGWTTRTADGDVESHCSFGDCAKDGWTSRHPDGTESSTSCSFGDCFKDGWTTRHPDGTESETSCSFGECMKDGWTTRHPDGTESSTSCNFSDCAKDGWTTRLPSGSEISCSCNFNDCLKDGASCN